MADAGGDSLHLDEPEQEQAKAHAPLPARVVHEIIRQDGEDALARESHALLWSGFAAGLSMGFSFLVEALLRAGLPEAPWRHLVESVGYAVGFVIVVMGKQQLFTESTLSAVLPVLTRRDRETALRCLRLWAYVFVGNIAGTWVFAAALAYGHPFTPEVGMALSSLAAQAMDGAFWPVLLEGVFAGWLIALMAWLLPGLRGERITVIVLVTYVVALAQLSHIIAGSAEAAFAVLHDGASLGHYAGHFLLPTLIGNTIGGVLLVALLNHAPLAGEVEGAER